MEVGEDPPPGWDMWAHLNTPQDMPDPHRDTTRPPRPTDTPMDNKGEPKHQHKPPGDHGHQSEGIGPPGAAPPLGKDDPHPPPPCLEEAHSPPKDTEPDAPPPPPPGDTQEPPTQNMDSKEDSGEPSPNPPQDTPAESPTHTSPTLTSSG